MMERRKDRENRGKERRGESRKDLKMKGKKKKKRMIKIKEDAETYDNRY